MKDRSTEEEKQLAYQFGREFARLDRIASSAFHNYTSWRNRLHPPLEDGQMRANNSLDEQFNKGIQEQREEMNARENRV